MQLTHLLLIHLFIHLPHQLSIHLSQQLHLSEKGFLLGCPQHPLRTYVIWIEKKRKICSVDLTPPPMSPPKRRRGRPKKTFWVHHLLRALQKRKEEGLGKKPRSFEALCMFTWNRYNVIKLFYCMTYVTSFNLCDYLKWIWYYCESWIYINQVIPNISF